MVALRNRAQAVRISIPVYTLYIAVVWLLLVLAGGGIIGWNMLYQSTDQGQHERLTAENYQLKGRVLRYQAAMDTFQVFLASTEEMDNRLRAAAGLYLIPSDVRKVGVGGKPVPGEDAGVDHLLRRTSYQEQSLGEIEQAITSQAERLARIPSILPVRGWVTSRFGNRRDPFTGRNNFHDGMDIVAPYGTRIVAAADGKVVYAGWLQNWGRVVEIDHGNGLRTFYAHCQSVAVAVGDSISRGQSIARLGSSGRSTGAHLHYGVRRKGVWVNPDNYIISN